MRESRNKEAVHSDPHRKSHEGHSLLRQTEQEHEAAGSFSCKIGLCSEVVASSVISLFAATEGSAKPRGLKSAE